MRLGGEPRLVLDRERDGDPSHDVSLSIASTVRRVKTHRLRLHRDDRAVSIYELRPLTTFARGAARDGAGDGGG